MVVLGLVVLGMVYCGYGPFWEWVGSGNGRVRNGLSRIGRSRIDTSTGSS